MDLKIIYHNDLILVQYIVLQTPNTRSEHFPIFLNYETTVSLKMLHLPSSRVMRTGLTAYARTCSCTSNKVRIVMT